MGLAFEAVVLHLWPQNLQKKLQNTFESHISRFNLGLPGISTVGLQFSFATQLTKLKFIAGEASKNHASGTPVVTNFAPENKGSACTHHATQMRKAIFHYLTHLQLVSGAKTFFSDIKMMLSFVLVTLLMNKTYLQLLDLNYIVWLGGVIAEELQLVKMKLVHRMVRMVSSADTLFGLTAPNISLKS